MEHISAAVKIIALQAMLKVAERISAKEVEGMKCNVFMDNKDPSFRIHHPSPNVEADKSQTEIIKLDKNWEQKKTAQEEEHVESASNAFTATTKTGKKTGGYDLLDGIHRKNSRITSVQTWTKITRKTRSMKYGGKGNKIDHFSTFNTVQKPPTQQEGWNCMLHLQQRLSSLWSWPGSWHFTGASVHRLRLSQLRPAAYIRQKNFYSNRKNKAWADVAEMYTTRSMKAADAQEEPTLCVYHTILRTIDQPTRTGLSPQDKQSENESESKPQIQRASYSASSQGEGLGERSVTRIYGELLFVILIICDFQMLASCHIYVQMYSK